MVFFVFPQMLSTAPSAKVIQQTQNQIALQKNMQTKAITQQSIINQELALKIRQGTPDKSAGKLYNVLSCLRLTLGKVRQRGPFVTYLMSLQNPI